MPLRPVSPTEKLKPGEIRIRKKATGEYFAIPKSEWENIVAEKQRETLVTPPKLQPVKEAKKKVGLFTRLFPGGELARGLGLALARLTPEIRGIEQRISERTATPEELEFYQRLYGEEAPTSRGVITSATELAGLAASPSLGRLIRRLRAPKIVGKYLGKPVTNRIQVAPGLQVRGIPSKMPRLTPERLAEAEAPLRWRWVPGPHPGYPPRIEFLEEGIRKAPLKVTGVVRRAVTPGAIWRVVSGRPLEALKYIGTWEILRRIFGK